MDPIRDISVDKIMQANGITYDRVHTPPGDPGFFYLPGKFWNFKLTPGKPWETELRSQYSANNTFSNYFC